MWGAEGRTAVYRLRDRYPVVADDGYATRRPRVNAMRTRQKFVLLVRLTFGSPKSSVQVALTEEQSPSSASNAPPSLDWKYPTMLTVLGCGRFKPSFLYF